jgi:hypothetical protein
VLLVGGGAAVASFSRARRKKKRMGKLEDVQPVFRTETWRKLNGSMRESVGFKYEVTHTEPLPIFGCASLRGAWSFRKNRRPALAPPWTPFAVSAVDPPTKK